MIFPPLAAKHNELKKCAIDSGLKCAVVTVAAPTAQAAEKLSDVLCEAKWDGIVGTWVDADTKGEAYKVTCAWKIEDRVIEVSTKYSGRETVALMGVNGKTGDVYHMGADSDGTSSLGKWDVEENGDAVLGIVYTSGNGQEGALSIRHHQEGKDVVIVTIELPEPIKFKLIRSAKRQR